MEVCGEWERLLVLVGQRSLSRIFARQATESGRDLSQEGALVQV